jgi:Protein of unknown function (DUF533)
MSLGKTLLKVAIGIAVAKGVSTLAKGRSGGAMAGTPDPADPGRGTRYTKPAPGGLGDLMDNVLGGGQSRRTTGRDTQGGGLDDLLSQITGGRSEKPDDTSYHTPTPRPPRRNAPQGGLDDLLGQFTGQSRGTGGAPAGGLGGLLEAVLGGAAAGGIGGALGGIEPKAAKQELEAALALRAMLQAVKCDGDLDDDERGKLMESLGEATEAEVAFVKAELQRPVDLDDLVRQVPNGMEEQVYMASLMAINLDSQKEAQYLTGLAEALELTAAEVNRLHDRVGAPHIFR